MSSPFVRRFILFIIRVLQAVLRHTAFLFRILTRPSRILGTLSFSFLILPIYQLIGRLKRVTLRKNYSFLAILVGQPLIIAMMATASIGGIIVNLIAPRTARGESIGQKTILFALTRDEEIAVEETIVVTHGKRPPAYYTNDSHALLWRLRAPLSTFTELPPLQTSYGGSTLITPQAPSTKTTQTPARTTPTRYVIQPGDTLSTIAEKLGVSVETILWENNLRVTSLLRIGQELTILPTSGVSHRIVRNETLASIARRYGVTIDEIQKQNGITANQPLTIGQILVIPGGRPFRAAAAPRVQTPIRTFRDTVAPNVRSTLPTARLFWPTAGRKLNQYFTWRHTGIDIDGDYTSPIYAADDGTVTISGWGRGYGIHIDIDHGKGMKTRYAHNSKNFVRVGERVKRGQLIGMVGSTGRSTGPHIHFEVIINGRFVNPLNYTR